MMRSVPSAAAPATCCSKRSLGSIFSPVTWCPRPAPSAPENAVCIRSEWGWLSEEREMWESLRCRARSGAVRPGTVTVAVVSVVLMATILTPLEADRQNAIDLP